MGTEELRKHEELCEERYYEIREGEKMPGSTNVEGSVAVGYAIPDVRAAEAMQSEHDNLGGQMNVEVARAAEGQMPYGTVVHKPTRRELEKQCDRVYYMIRQVLGAQANVQVKEGLEDPMLSRSRSRSAPT